ncbi:MAG: transglutaminase family protein, partial [Comamonadaceae bacterium]
MHIKIGYDIELGVSAPTALIYMLQVHPSRAHDIVGAENITISPPLVTDHYRDAFDNHCARVHVPYGVSSVRLRNEAVVYDSGLPDVVD